VEEKE